MYKGEGWMDVGYCDDWCVGGCWCWVVWMLFGVCLIVCCWVCEGVCGVGVQCDGCWGYWLCCFVFGCIL